VALLSGGDPEFCALQFAATPVDGLVHTSVYRRGERATVDLFHEEFGKRFSHALPLPATPAPTPVPHSRLARFAAALSGAASAQVTRLCSMFSGRGWVRSVCRAPGSWLTACPVRRPSSSWRASTSATRRASCVCCGSSDWCWRRGYGPLSAAARAGLIPSQPAPEVARFAVSAPPELGEILRRYHIPELTCAGSTRRACRYSLLTAATARRSHHRAHRRPEERR
jgi:hypothetical protein